jgi:excinuclease ABC subunit C
MNEEKLISQLNNIPKLPGVYFMRDNTGKIVYIGKAKNLASRIKSYFVKNVDFRLISTMLYNITNIEYIVCGSEKEALLLEQKFIKELQPQYNIIWRDDKSYLMLKIDLNEPFPRVSFIRYKEYISLKQKPKNVMFFGPYPSAKQIKSVLKFILKTFKIRRCKYNSTKFFDPKYKKNFLSCIYYQTKQCVAPCIYASEPGKLKETKENYDNLIKNVILFLQGKNKKLVEQLEKEIEIYSKQLKFEQAIVLRDTLKYISNLFSKCIIKEVKEKDVVDYTLQKIDVLKKIKEKFNLRTLPVIIEAIDISTFYGSGSCGSVVRFVNGEPDKYNYRRYRIKSLTEQQVDDYTMMKEVVSRRYKRLLDEKKQLPNLVIIDGGRGQLNIALQVLKEFKIDDKIDLLSIAKQEEIVYSTTLVQPIKLLGSQEDNFIKFIRDEAHRFAIKYNRTLMKKGLGIK